MNLSSLTKHPWRRHSCLLGPEGTPDSSGRLPAAQDKSVPRSRYAAGRSACATFLVVVSLSTMSLAAWRTVISGMVEGNFRQRICNC